MNKVKTLFSLIVLGAALTACGGTESSDDKIAVVEGYLSASNDQNWDEAAKFLADDVIFETPTGKTEGLDVWLASVRSDTSVGIRQEASSISADGNTVRIEMIVMISDLEFPAIGTAIVEDGKIQSFTVSEP